MKKKVLWKPSLIHCIILNDEALKHEEQFNFYKDLRPKKRIHMAWTTSVP